MRPYNILTVEQSSPAFLLPTWEGL